MQNQNQLAMSELSLLHSQFPHLATWIKLKLENGEEVEGQIFTYDKISNVVVLQQKCQPENPLVEHIPGASNKYNFRIIKISYIKEISLPSKENNETENSSEENNKVSSSTEENNKKKSETSEGNNKNENNNHPSTLSTLVPVCPVSIEDVINRERRSLKEEYQRQNRIGVGVTQEAQQIFDALSKTMPCSWNTKSIIVMDEVIIHPPYHVENCAIVPNKQVADSILERVQKVLELERKKIKRMTTTEEK